MRWLDRVRNEDVRKALKQDAVVNVVKAKQKCGEREAGEAGL